MSIDFDALFRRDDGSPPAPSRPPAARWPWLVAAGIAVAIVVSREVAWAATDMLWFASLGQAEVFRTRIVAPLEVFGAVFLIGWLWLAANWLLALRRVAPANTWPGQAAAQLGGFGPRWAVHAAAAAVAGLSALAAAANWQQLALYHARSDFGIVEPIFNRDVGYYVFELPVLRLIGSLGLSWVLAALIGTAVIYAFGGVLEFGRSFVQAGREGHWRGRVVRVGPGGGLPQGIRGHIMLLAGVLVLVFSTQLWLGRYAILFADRGSDVFFGPGYADITARLPGITLAAGLTAAAGVLFILAARWVRPTWPAAVLLVAVLARFGLGEAYPALVQSYVVRPNELERERPYIQHSIDLTRTAYGLTDVQTVDYSPTKRVTAELLAAHQATVSAVRLWDWRVLLDYLEQKQSIRPYYQFLDVDVDRYPHPEGTLRQVELAVRELDVAGLRNPTWINRHLEYTHGFGLAVAPVDEVDAGGQPVLWARDLPPVVDPALGRTLDQPRIYFGEAVDGEYAIVGTRTSEFDYPVGDANARTTYDGADGVGVGSYLRRLLFTLRFGDTELMLSDGIAPDSRVLMYRHVQERLARLAPFLSFDADPYPVITAEGGVVWIQDAYTLSDRFPYAEPTRLGGGTVGGTDFDFGARSVNYLRNSVKATVDAYDGTVAFYVVDPSDPIVAAWARVFPSLFQPAEAMPDALRSHWRYPETLFRTQAHIYARYHMANPDVFYNAEDLWSVPMETRAQGESQAIEPYYVTLKLRDSDAPEFLLMLPYAPAGKKNMIAWLAARCDPAHYGKLVLYNFGKGQQIDGPEQIESRIDNDTDISGQLTLWSQAGSRTIRGNLLVIPLGDALLYAEPLYLQAASNALPELKRVIVADGERVAMRPTLVEALAALTGGTGSAAGAGGASDSGGTSGADAPAGGSVSPGSATGGDADRPPASAAGPGDAGTGDLGASTDVATVIATAQRHREAAADALRDGDWIRFGQEMDAYSATLDRLAAITGAALPPALPTVATPAPAGTPDTP